MLRVVWLCLCVLQVPKTPGERIVTIMCMLIGGVSFAFVVGSITGLISALDVEGTRYQSLTGRLSDAVRSVRFCPICPIFKLYLSFCRHRNTMDILYEYTQVNKLPAQLGKDLRRYFMNYRCDFMFSTAQVYDSWVSSSSLVILG